MNVYEILKYFIIMAGLALAGCEIYLYVKYVRNPKKLLYAFMGIYWAIYYIYSVARPLLGTDYVAHQTFSRPGILFMIILILTSAYDNIRRLKHVAD